jgi:UrcA family protein
LPTASLARPVDVTDNGSGIMTERISFADLDLAKQSDIGLLKARIDNASQEVCYTVEHPDRQYCVIDAVASAQPGFDAAVAAARHPSVTVSPTAATLIISAPRN